MFAFLIVGIIMVVLSARANKKRKWLVQNGIRVPGVIAVQAMEEINGRELYFPIVKVDDAGLGAREIRLSRGTNMERTVGSKILLVYPPGEPENIREYNDSRTFGNVVLLLGGLFFGFVGLVWIAVSLLWDKYVGL